MNDAIRKADVLIEALSYIRTFRDKLIVIKLGGSAMEDADVLPATLQDVVFMATVGMRPILVHGGGKAIDRAMAAAGLKPRKVQGRRYTDEATLDIVVRVLLKETCADIEAQIRQLGGRAVGPRNGSSHYLFGEKLLLPGGNGQAIDLGRVGRVTRVDVPLIEDFCKAGVVPVIPSLAIDDAGDWLNVNADTAAAAVAAQVHAEKLVLLTDTPGILLDREDAELADPQPRRRRLPRPDRRWRHRRGHDPKVEACLEGLRAGVGKTHIIDGRRPPFVASGDLHGPRRRHAKLSWLKT